jgi:hypothetical protein
MGRDARGRASEAYWKLLMQDSLYAERLPIGQESVIREGNPEVFRRFYKKWYRPERMAVRVITPGFLSRMMSGGDRNSVSAHPCTAARSAATRALPDSWDNAHRRGKLAELPLGVCEPQHRELQLWGPSKARGRVSDCLHGPNWLSSLERCVECKITCTVPTLHGGGGGGGL